MLDIILEITLSCLPLHMLHCSLTILQQIVWTCLRPQQQWMKSQASAKCKGPRWFKVHLLRFCCHIIMQPWRQCCCLAHYFKKKCALAVTITNKHKPTRVSFHCKYIFLSSAKGLILIQTLRRDKKNTTILRFMKIQNHPLSSCIPQWQGLWLIFRPTWQLDSFTFYPTGNLKITVPTRNLNLQWNQPQTLQIQELKKSFWKSFHILQANVLHGGHRGYSQACDANLDQFGLNLGLGSGGLVLTHYWLVLIYKFGFFCCIC